MRYVSGKKSAVGLEIERYCRSNGISVTDFCVRIGVSYPRVMGILHGSVGWVRREVADRFAKFGFNLGDEFEVRERTGRRRLVIYPDELSVEQLGEIYRIIGCSKGRGVGSKR